MFGFSLGDLALGLLAGLLAGGWLGADWQEGQFAKATVAQQKTELRDIVKADFITEKAGEESAAHQQKIQVITRTIVREVPNHVTAQDDAACTVPLGALRLLDAAARGLPPVPGPAGRSDGAAPGMADHAGSGPAGQ
jgi:hypothetical protein